MIDKIREAFEHWYKSEAAWHGSDTEMDCGEYTDGNVELAFCAWQGSLAQQPATEASPVTMQQVMAAYSYATEHPHKYLRGTTNWCAAFAHSLNEQMSAGQRTSSATPAAPAAPVAQEPVAWGAFQCSGRRAGKLYAHADTEAMIEAHILDVHRSNDSLTLRKGPLYTAPPAAEQPDTVAVPREVLERAVDRLTHGHELDKACHELRALLGGGEA